MIAGISTTALAAAAAVAVAMLFAFYGAWVLLNPSRSARDRLDDLTQRPTTSYGLAGFDQGPDLNPMTVAVARIATPTNEGELGALRKALVQAGFRSRHAMEFYSLGRVAFAILLPVLFSLYPLQLRLIWIIFWSLALAFIGYQLPRIFVANSRQHRMEDLLRSFPDALDLLVASVEAGLGLDASFRRVSEELDATAPTLSSELRLVNHEMNAGVPRLDALRHLQQRTGLDEFNALVNVLAQSERFGTPVAQSLRIHSGLVRTRRMQTAEENAAKISPKLTVAMILFILPCLIVILVGPAAVNVKNTLLPALAAQHEADGR